MLLALALACAAPPATEAYLDAALTGSPCGAIDDPALRGECWSFSAQKEAEAGRIDQALSLCEQSTALWRDECTFLVSDTVDSTFELADQLCNRANALRPQCLGHASNREARVLLSEPGGETAALARLAERTRAYRSPEMARDEARRLVLQRVADRAVNQPFDVEICGDLSVDLCRDVYIERLMRGKGADPKTGCDDPAARQSLAPWTPTELPLVQEAWAQLCTRGSGPQRSL